MNIKEEKAARKKAAGKRVLDMFTNNTLAEDIRDILNKKSFELAKIVFNRDYQYTRGLNYMIWNLREWYKQTPKHNRKEQEEECKKITDTKDKEKCIKRAKQPATLHKTLYPAFVKACSDTIPAWEVIEKYLREAWKSNYKAGTEEERAERDEDNAIVVEEIRLSTPMLNGANEWRKDFPIWDTKAKERYLTRFESRGFGSMTLNAGNESHVEDQRYFIPLPDEIGKIKATTGKCKGGFIIGVWFVAHHWGAYGDLGVIVHESTSKVECEIMLSWYAFETVKVRMKVGDIWVKVNKWLYNLTDEEAKQRDKPKLLSMFTFTTEEEFNEKEAFLIDHLPLWQQDFICGVRLKKDGTPYPTTRGRKRTEEENRERDKQGEKARRTKIGFCMAKPKEKEVLK